MPPYAALPPGEGCGEKAFVDEPGIAQFVEVGRRVACLVDGLDGDQSDGIVAAYGFHENFHFGLVAAGCHCFDDVLGEGSGVKAVARLGVTDAPS